MMVEQVQRRCKKCGKHFMVDAPKSLDPYVLQLWSESNLLCDDCAGIDRFIKIGHEDKTRSIWDPKKHDSIKIGLGATIEDTEGVH